MSHKATNWAIARRGLKPTAKIILWHLCDRHHPDHGCFPSQETLADDCEISRGTLNRYLDELEALSLIRRIKRSDKKSRRQKSTLYLFAFDFNDPHAFDPATSVPETDAEEGAEEGEKPDVESAPEGAEPCSRMRHGSVSQNGRKPCLKNGKSRVSNLDTNPVREPIKNQRVGARGGGLSAAAVFWVEKIRAGKLVPDTALTPALKSEIEASGQLTEAEMIAAGVVARKRTG